MDPKSPLAADWPAAQGADALHPTRTPTVLFDFNQGKRRFSKLLRLDSGQQDVPTSNHVFRCASTRVLNEDAAFNSFSCLESATYLSSPVDENCFRSMYSAKTMEGRTSRTSTMGKTWRLGVWQLSKPQLSLPSPLFVMSTSKFRRTDILPQRRLVLSCLPNCRTESGSCAHNVTYF